MQKYELYIFAPDDSSKRRFKETGQGDFCSETEGESLRWACAYPGLLINTIPVKLDRS